MIFPPRGSNSKFKYHSQIFREIKKKKKIISLSEIFFALCNKQGEAILTGETFATKTREFCDKSWRRS